MASALRVTLGVCRAGYAGIIGDVSLLIIDTCGDIGSIALTHERAASPEIASATLPGRTASERLIATIRDLTVGGNVSLNALDAIALVNGPGSFTGVRVGVSAAKGLAEAVNVPLIAISRLAVLARSAAADGRVLAVLDAGRGEFYAGIYLAGACVREALAKREELVSGTLVGTREHAVTIVCETGPYQVLGELAPRLVSQPIADSALPIAMERLRERDFAEIATLDANYLRRTDAEIFAKHASKTTHAGHAK
jgi:tRNA threonylcarbamoyladenosine biosynthesis protein TsaB